MTEPHEEYDDSEARLPPHLAGTRAQEPQSSMRELTSKDRRVAFNDAREEVELSFGQLSRDGETSNKMRITRNYGTDIPPNFIAGPMSPLGTLDTSSRGYINISDQMLGSLVAENFEASPAMHGENSMDSSSKFRFERSARKSVLLNLGLAHNIGRFRHTTHTEVSSSMDIYSKVDEKNCVFIYTATLVGIGTFDLAGALAKCGLIPGLCALMWFSGIHVFLCHRIVEVPQLLEQSFELYAGVAKVCLPKFLYKLCAFGCILTWFTVSYMFEKQSLANIIKICSPLSREDGELRLDRDFWILKVIFVICLVPVAWATNVTRVSWCARWQVYAMCAAGGIQVVVAITFLLYRNNAPETFPVKSSVTYWGEHIREGLQSMALAFVGMGILPYVVAEMLNPHNAHRIINRSCRNVTLFYATIALVCYVGWGDDILKCEISPLDAIVDVTARVGSKGLSIFFRICSWLVVVCFTAKTMLAFPLFMWPLFREVEGAVAFEESPATEVQLPWATKGQLGKRKALKACVVLLMGPFLMLPSWLYKPSLELMIYGPMCFTHFALPAWAAFYGIWKHWEAVQLRQARQLTMRQIENQGHSVWASVPSNTTRRYFCGSFRQHFFCTATIALATICFCNVLFLQSSCKELFSEHLQKQLCPKFVNHEISSRKCIATAPLTPNPQPTPLDSNGHEEQEQDSSSSSSSSSSRSSSSSSSGDGVDEKNNAALFAGLRLYTNNNNHNHHNNNNKHNSYEAKQNDNDDNALRSPAQPTALSSLHTFLSTTYF